jgi:hypothetical protein
VEQQSSIAFDVLTPEQELRRTLMSCMLFSGTFYESGQSIVDRLSALVKMNRPHVVEELAREAKFKMHIRSAPLMLAVELAKHHPTYPLAQLICDLVERPDDITKVLTYYGRNQAGVKKLGKLDHQIRKGLGKAFNKFGAYPLDKYKEGTKFEDSDARVTLVDALRVVHPKPKDEAQSEFFRQLRRGELPSAGTWEQQLSAGADKKETFTSLLQENKLGYTALLKNLRNMTEAGVDAKLVADAILEGAPHCRELPFRFIAAAKHAPQFAAALNEALMMTVRRAGEDWTLQGDTAVLVDVSYSMVDQLSAKSEMRRYEAACALALLLQSVVKGNVLLFSFSDSLVKLTGKLTGIQYAVKEVWRSQDNNGTNLSASTSAAIHYLRDEPVKRMIIITDEQETGNKEPPACPYENGYILNVAGDKRGVGYDTWTHIHGFSDQVVRYIYELESQKLD